MSFCRVSLDINLFENLPLEEVFCPLDQSGIFLKMQSIWSAMYNRSFLVENHIRFNETPGASFQDVSFAFQVYACAKILMLLPGAFYHYRISNLNLYNYFIEFYQSFIKL